MDLSGLDWEELCALAGREVAALLAELPAPLRERAGQVPVLFEPRPSRDLQADGIEADTLGLFTGPEWAEAGDVPLPPQIILYLENLREMAETDGQRFRDEIRTTFLHELGHFLGLDEDELTDRGLE
jgi:predicted Zn-dependent protease with MMP-like domain